MSTSTNAPTGLPSSPGVLRPEEFATRITFAEVEPSVATSRWVERVWSAAWDLPPGEETTTSLVPKPSISLTVERGTGERVGREGDGVWLTGVLTRRFDITQHGRGGVVGLKFHPGGFTALTGIRARDLTDRLVRAAELLPGCETIATVPLDATAAAEPMCDFLDSLAADPATDSAEREPRYELVRTALEELRDPEITRVDQLAMRCGSPIRTLQRLFGDYVGVGPKWLLRQNRLLDAVTALDDGSAESLADLAARLGWYDQNQFSRDFTAIVGVPPQG